MAHQQTAVFCLLASQKKVHGTWITPTCLAVLRRKEYLGPKKPQMTLDYWEMQREETITLAIILQWCAIQAGTPPDIFCGAVQELHEHLALVLEEGNLFIMEKEIWEGVSKDPMAVTTSTRAPTPKRASSPKRVPSDSWGRGTYPLYFTRPSLHVQIRMGGAPSGTGPGAKKVTTATPWVLSTGPRGPCNATLRRHTPAQSFDFVGSLCNRVNRDDHFTHPSNRWGPLPPSGVEFYQDVSTEHFLPGTMGTLPKALAQVNTCSPNEVNFRPSEYPLSW